MTKDTGIRLEEVMYPVSIKDLQVTGPDKILRSRLATIDDRSGEILGTVSPKYNLIQNADLFKALEEIKEDVGVELQDLSVVKNKRATIFRYAFNEDRLKTIPNSSTVNDKVNFRMDVINSFDSGLGSSRIVFSANRLVCSNGLVIPREVGKVSFRELAPLTSTSIKDKLASRLEPMFEVVNTWNRWATEIPEVSKVHEFIASEFPRKRKEALLEQYDKSQDKSLWALYNILTYFCTHDLKSRVPTDIRMKQYEVDRKIAKLYKINLN